MSKILLIVSLFLAGSIFSACSSAAPEVVQCQTEPECAPTPEVNETQAEQEAVIKLPSGGKAEFKGVSFKYNPEIFGEAAVENVAEYLLESETDRPFSEHAQHLNFSLKDLKRKQITEIKVFSVESFRRVFAISDSYIEQFNEQLNGLQKVIKDKNFRLEKDIPLIHFGNGGQELQAKVKHFSFQNGKGILFVAHWSYEVALISNENLEYVFGGLTEDEKYYVLARMPVSVSFLPKRSTEEFEGYKRSYLLEDYPHPDDIKQRYKKYVSKITQKLEGLPAKKYEPNLKHFEEIISSLKIEK